MKGKINGGTGVKAGRALLVCAGTRILARIGDWLGFHQEICHQLCTIRKISQFHLEPKTYLFFHTGCERNPGF
jgi:hypothetical protein